MHSPRRILLLEPNQLLASQCRQFLASRDYRVTWAKNAQDAINAADKLTPHIAVVELLLTAHSGIEFLYEFRSYSEWSKVPVLLFSRIPRTELAISDQALLDLGVVGYLYKPETSLSRLASRIETFIGK